MKTRFDRPDAPASAARRQVLTVAALGAGMAVLPAASAFATSVTPTPAPTPSPLPSPAPAAAIALGYCALDTVFHQGARAVLTDTISLRPSRGNYLVRIAGAGSTLPFALTAQYSTTALHTFWQAWKVASLLQRSPPVAIRWDSPRASALPLHITLGSSQLSTAIPAQNGFYVLMLPSATQRVPAWSELALKPQSTGGVEYTLVSRTTGAPVPFPYALFEVQGLGVA